MKSKMQKLAVILPKAFPANIELISINITIRNNWKNIVTENLHKFVAFERAEFTKFNELKVVINTCSAAMLLVKPIKKSIISAIKILTNTDNVKLCFKHDVA